MQSQRVFYGAVDCWQSVTTFVVSHLGNSLSAILDGEARLTFLNRGEDYVMNMPYAHCKGWPVPLGPAGAVHEQR